MNETTEPKAKSIYRFLKRAIDVLISFVSLLSLVPLFTIVALISKITSPGPVFVWQYRIGLDGKEFVYLKFRTMEWDATEQSIGPIFQLQEDPRITRWGRFLRKTNLDELPALISVLRGDMSLVGPRPALSLEVKRYSEKQRMRLKIKPGLTGYWQTFGREKGITDPNEVIEMDLEYMRNQSLWLDLKIIVRTVWMTILSEGAY